MIDYTQKFSPRRYGPRQLLILQSLAERPLKYAELVNLHQQKRSNITIHTQKLAALGLIAVFRIENPQPKPGQGATCNEYRLTEKGREVLAELSKTSTTSTVTQIAINRTET